MAYIKCKNCENTLWYKMNNENTVCLICNEQLNMTVNQTIKVN